MKKIWVSLVAVLVCATAASQGGGGGFGGAGAFQGGQGGRGQGNRQQEYDRSTQAIEARIATYLTTEEIKNILTPGEYSEWPMKLKAGQVVIAEARSDAFDPALEVVQLKENDPAPEKAKALGTNDDRYPGDQRPLLLWRCDKDGEYMLRARCFRDKAGGQFFVKFQVYDSMDLLDNEAHEKAFDDDGRVLLRVPMKAGQIKEVVFEQPKGNYRGGGFESVISPIGLPDISLLSPAGGMYGASFMASVAGDYYVLANTYGAKGSLLRCHTNVHTPIPLAETPSVTGVGILSSPTIWVAKVKAGQLLQAAIPELTLNSQIVVFEEPDISKYDMSKPETNPFFPRVKTKEEVEKGDSHFYLAARHRDTRVANFAVKRDAKVWIASTGMSKKPYTLHLGPAAKAFNDTEPISSELKIGYTDYWSFDANVGDVMTINSKAFPFSQGLTLYDPDYNQLWRRDADIDEASMAGNLIVTKPGRYHFAFSAFGNGASGKYELARKVFTSKEFSKATPASGEIAEGQVQVWKFTAKPGDPLLMRWKSAAWNYSIAVYEDNGARSGFGLVDIDATTRYGILNVDKPRTYLIVLMGTGAATKYSIELNDLPGTKD